jgi:hypothetical protein
MRELRSGSRSDHHAVLTREKALLAFGVVCAVGLAPPRTACAMGIT